MNKTMLALDMQRRPEMTPLHLSLQPVQPIVPVSLQLLAEAEEDAPTQIPRTLRIRGG